LESAFVSGPSRGDQSLVSPERPTTTPPPAPPISSNGSYIIFGIGVVIGIFIVALFWFVLPSFVVVPIKMNST
jgi:hypothetical protein